MSHRGKRRSRFELQAHHRRPEIGAAHGRASRDARQFEEGRGYIDKLHWGLDPPRSDPRNGDQKWGSYLLLVEGGPVIEPAVVTELLSVIRYQSDD